MDLEGFRLFLFTVVTILFSSQFQGFRLFLFFQSRQYSYSDDHLSLFSPQFHH